MGIMDRTDAKDYRCENLEAHRSWVDRLRNSPDELGKNLLCLLRDGMKADQWEDHRQYEALLDIRDAALIYAAANCLVSHDKQIRELREWRNPEVWEALEKDCTPENLTKALRHGRAMEARVVVLEKALLEQNKATGLIPAVLEAMRSEQTGEKDE